METPYGGQTICRRREMTVGIPGIRGSVTPPAGTGPVRNGKSMSLRAGAGEKTDAQRGRTSGAHDRSG